jgi:uncharacterized protein YneR
MNILIDREAAIWYKEELGLTEGDFVRFFVRYGGCSTVQSGFSLGVAKEDETNDIAVKTIVNGITFYIDEKDVWYFDGHDLIVKFNSAFGEPEFEYNK